MNIDPREYSTSEFYGYLTSAVVPRPIAFASTMSREGKVNLSPYSFFNAFSSNPPILVFSPVNSTRDNTTKNTLDNVREHNEVVINIVNYAMVQQMSLASAAYPKGVNEFVKAGFTEVSSERVKPPRVAESPVAFECKVQQVIALGEAGGAGHLVICEVLLAHVREEVLDEEQKIDLQRLDAVGRMGGNLYCRASGDALFEVTRPGRETAIGIDQLPAYIRESAVLTGSDLAQLAGVPAVPDEALLRKYANNTQVKSVLAHPNSVKLAHQTAQDLIGRGEVEVAWAVLLTIGPEAPV